MSPRKTTLSTQAGHASAKTAAGQTVALEPRLLNRELSWLEFNQRVLDEARLETTPLLSRLMFLAITSSNLDEFFMIRVGGLLQLADQSPERTDPAGMTAAEQLRAIDERTHRMTQAQYECLMSDIEPSLVENGIYRLKTDGLNERAAKFLRNVFDEQLFPVLSPRAIHPDRDFPQLPSRTLNLLVRLAPANDEPGASRFSVISLPRTLDRFLTVPSERGYEFILLEDVVKLFVDRFHSGETIHECVPFRILRNADMSIQEDMASDLLTEMEQLLDARKQSQCVKLEIHNSVSGESLRFLQRGLELSESLIYPVSGPVHLSDFMEITSIGGYENLRFETWAPRESPHVSPQSSMFDIVAQDDLLLCHPFESFDPVIRLIEEAANDPDVLAIKQILYRTSRDSPIVNALRRAAEVGKAVTAIVELKARFDEARNIEWARDLERAGVQVFYGVKGLKTHAKLAVVVRREPQGIRKYVHFGTGNYNESTARSYTDVSFITSNQELGADATSFFHAITGFSEPPQFLHLQMAPIGLRDRIIEMIRVETDRARNGHRARILAKLNSLVDPAIIDALYEASAAGVQIDLNIRGICCLRPGLEGLSENIRVVSIVDRFLEHSRIIYFLHGGDHRVFLSSADWMPRNLDRRIELLVPVDHPASKRRLIELLELCVRDNVKGRTLSADGSFIAPVSAAGANAIHSQRALHKNAREAEQKARDSRQITFEPHRAPGHQID